MRPCLCQSPLRDNHSPVRPIDVGTYRASLGPRDDHGVDEGGEYWLEVDD